MKAARFFRFSQRPPGRVGRERISAPSIQPEGNSQIGEGGFLHGLDKLGALGGVALHEFSAGRGVEKKVGGFYGGSLHRRGGELGYHPAAFALYGIAGIGPGAERCDLEAGNGENGIKGLAAETKGGEGINILENIKLAGGVPAQGQAQILAVHAAPVVVHAYEAVAGLLDLYFYLCSAGVQ